MKDSGLSALEMNLGNTPYLMNISDDPSLAGLLVFQIKPGKTEIGKNPKEGSIKIHGLGLQDSHAVFSNTGDTTLTVKPNPNCRVLVNGIYIQQETPLKHN